MKIKLTAKSVSGLEPSTYAYEARDTELKGFLLRVQPSGVMTYYVDYRNAEGRRNRFRIGNSGNVTPQQARDVAQTKAAQVTQGADLQLEKKTARREAELSKRRTLRVFLEDVYAPWAKQHHSKTTDTARKITTAFPAFLNKSMAEITPWLIEKWRTEHKKNGKAPATVNRELAALKGVLTKAVEWNYLAVHPLPRGKVKQEKIDDIGLIRYLTTAEEGRLREALDRRERTARIERATANEWREVRDYELLPDLWRAPFVDYLKPMVLLALNTGLRRGELFNLDWESMNLATRIVTVAGATAKSKKTRHVPLNDEAFEVVSAWKSQAPDKGYVFPSADGERMDNVQTSWENLAKAAKLLGFRFHDLRHTFASKLVMAGVDLNTVRELLGHSDIKMTLRYAHLAPQHKADAVAKLVAHH